MEEDARIDVETTKAACDQETWLQEYCCQFVSQASDWIPAELLQQCVSSEASTALTPGPSPEGRGGTRIVGEGSLYAGWDIARRRDASVIWLTELVGDVTWTRRVVEMRDMPTPDQVRKARSLMPSVRRMVACPQYTL